MEYRNTKQLFTMENAKNFLERRRGAMTLAAKELSLTAFQNKNVDSLAQEMASKYKVDSLAINIDEKYAQKTHDENIIRIAVPYEGDGNLFKIKPSDYRSDTSGGVYAEVINGVFFLYYRQSTASQMKQEIERELNLIEANLASLMAEIAQFNVDLAPLAIGVVRSRKADLDQREALKNELGIPFRD